MIVWGGLDRNLGQLNTGGKYNPNKDTWAATSTMNVPSPRSGHTGVWTGNRMIVWGGYSGGDTSTGGRYDPSHDTWQPTSVTNVPHAREGHTAIWDGSQMIVWGGFVSPSSYPNSGGRYDPVADSWTDTISYSPAQSDSQAAPRATSSPDATMIPLLTDSFPPGGRIAVNRMREDPEPEQANGMHFRADL
jgi:hypothetical protein